jgi:hypothetical protein
VPWRGRQDPAAKRGKAALSRTATMSDRSKPSDEHGQPRDTAMRWARTCYHHMAGQLALAITNNLEHRGLLHQMDDTGVLSDDDRRFSATSALILLGRSIPNDPSAGCASIGVRADRILPASWDRRCYHERLSWDGF